MQKTLKSALVTLFAALVVWSCSESDAPQGELSAEAKQFLSMRLGSANGLASSAMAPVNGSFSNLNSLTGGRLAGRVAEDSTEVPDNSGDDTTIWENPWQSCGTYTYRTNEDGTYTSIVDYGDGCWEGWDPWKYFMHGKITTHYGYTNDSTGSEFLNTYFYNSEYDNYGGYYKYEDTINYEWVMNGFYNSQGASTYNIETQEYSGWYEHESNSEYTANGFVYSYVGEGYTTYNQNKMTVVSNNYQFGYGDDYYNTKVLTPLVTDYSCFQSGGGVGPANANFCVFFVPVSGREEIEFKWGDKGGKFIIDYGNGECDNIITIIENGVSVEIDLSKEWYF